MPSIKFCFRIHIGFHWLGSFVIIAISTFFFWCIILEERIKKWCCSRNHYWFPFCCYTLLAPYAIGITKSTSLFIQEGPWEITLLKPFQLFGLDYLNPIPHAVFWSLLFNVMSYAAISVSLKEL
jgi:hypothetical protein